MSEAETDGADDQRADPTGGDDGAGEAGVDELTFEDAIERLEAIIERVESGKIGLEQALAEYEHGTKLIAHCRRILDTAQQRIAELTADEDGGLRIEEAASGEDAAPPGSGEGS